MAVRPQTTRPTWQEALMNPTAVALIGVSNDAGKMTGGPLRFLRHHGFAGRVYPVNPRHERIQGEPAWPSIEALPEVVDHAYLLVNTDDALAAVQACARAGVRVVTLLAGGFAEAGPEGLARQQALVDVARAHGMRVVGPNSLGLVNFHTGLALTATPALNAPLLQRGRLMVISQSGALMGAIVSRGFARGIGFSKAISVGNEADLTVGEVGEAFVDDPDTDVFLLFLETMRDAAALARFAQRAYAAGKPVIAYKLGRSEVGREMAVTHTGAIVGSDQAVDAFFRHHGILRVDQLETLIELPALIQGRRPLQKPDPAIGVVTTTGGGAALVVDRLGLAGVETRPPSRASLAQLATVGLAVNPGRVMDLTMAGTRYDAMQSALATLRGAPEFDLILTVVGNSSEFKPELAVKPIADAGPAGKPVAAFFGPNAETGMRLLADAGMAAFRTPESCADAIRAYFAWQPAQPASAAAACVPAAGAAVSAARTAGLDERTTLQVFAALGLPVADCRVVLPGAVPADLSYPDLSYPDLSYPVVAKILSPDIAHKTEAGGVVLGIQSASELDSAVEAIMTAARRHQPTARLTGVLVQPMVRGLGEVLLGYRRDAQVGPLITLAVGGVLAEIYGDSAVRLAPVDVTTAHAMIAEVKGLAPLRGYRNLPLGDLDALAQAIADLSQLAHVGDVIEAEINPVIVRGAGAGIVAVDGLMRLNDDSIHAAQTHQ